MIFSLVNYHTNLTIGLWVIINYADDEYPGEVTSIEDSDIEVSAMHKSVNAWKWPRPEDKIFYPATQIVRVIDPPTVAGNRRQFVFENISLIYSFASCLPVPCYVYNCVSLSVITYVRPSHFYVRPSHNLITIISIIKLSNNKHFHSKHYF